MHFETHIPVSQYLKPFLNPSRHNAAPRNQRSSETVLLVVTALRRLRRGGKRNFIKSHATLLQLRKKENKVKWVLSSSTQKKVTGMWRSQMNEWMITKLLQLPEVTCKAFFG